MTVDNLLPDRPSCVVVAMSGGVDSSTAAALLVQAGHQVSGLMARLWRSDGKRTEPDQAERSARQACERLGIPFHLLGLEETFRLEVVDYFADEYVVGRTPNPCLRCNRCIKFGALLDWVLEQGADYLATGHYARRRRVQGAYQLLRGVDRSKDQSYVLYALDQRALRHVLFPLGALHKEVIRKIAREEGLQAAERPESQEICFIPDHDYRSFLSAYRGGAVQPGPIYDTSGERIGTHQGLPFYTIGQRKGLGIAAPEPLYVIHIDAERNRLIVGTASELGRKRLVAQDVHFVSGKEPQGPVEVTAKIRYQAHEAEATVLPQEGARAMVEFVAPLRDITPGQAVVFYQGEVVLGGGIISDSLEG